MSAALFSLENAGMRYNGSEVLSGVTLDFAASQLVAIAGNGAGKSTLLGVMAGLRPEHTGRCCYRGTEIGRWKRRAFSRSVAFMPQSMRVEFPFTAEQVVLMGRTPHCHGLFESSEDWAAVERAMQTTDTVAFRGRDFRSLSGGERQLVILASALAQAPETLLLDEPTTFLDLKHGRVVADGTPASVLTAELLRDVFGVAGVLHRRPEGGPWIVYGP